VAVTWDRETLALWMDGILRAETPVIMRYHASTTSPSFRIGECDSGLGGLDFDIAELGFFSAALAADDLRRLGDPDLEFRSALSRFVEQIGLPPDGADGGPGTQDRPFGTLERARDAVRERRKGNPLPDGGIAIMLKAGIENLGRLSPRGKAIGATDEPDIPAHLELFFGGSDDIVENNIFHRCFTGVRISDRSYLDRKVNVAPNFVIDAYLAKAAANPVWVRRYPRFKTFPPQAKDTSVFLQGNVVARNIAYQCETFLSGSDRTMSLARIEQNWNEGDPGFRNPHDGDFRMRSNSPVFVACAFEPLPLDKMGLYDDVLRATWPVRHESGSYETLLIEDENPIVRKPASQMPVCRAVARTADIIVGVLKPGTRPDPGAKDELQSGDKWAVWRGTESANWQVWNAGILYFGGQGKDLRN
jgi:hypothetical protein